MRAYHQHPTIEHLSWDIDRLLRWVPKDWGDDFVLGETIPTPENSGTITPKAQMRVEPETVTITADDTTITGTYYAKGVVIRANRVRLEDCWISNSPTGAAGTVTIKNPEGNHVAVDANSSAYSGSVLERCTIVPDNPEVLCYGLIGSNVTTIRCYVAGGHTDCLNWQTSTSNNHLLPGSCYSVGDYLAPTVYDSDPDQNGGRSHSDCIQVANGSGHVVFGSHLAAIVGDSYSHGMVISPYAGGAIGGITVMKCWFSGGGAQFSAWANGLTDKAPVVPGIVLVDNRFDARGTLNDSSGGVMVPQSILLTPEGFMASRENIRRNLQTYPCTPATGTPYGASATPESPVPAYVYTAKNNW